MVTGWASNLRHIGYVSDTLGLLLDHYAHPRRCGCIDDAIVTLMLMLVTPKTSQYKEDASPTLSHSVISMRLWTAGRVTTDSG